MKVLSIFKHNKKGHLSTTFSSSLKNLKNQVFIFNFRGFSNKVVDKAKKVDIEEITVKVTKNWINYFENEVFRPNRRWAQDITQFKWKGRHVHFFCLIDIWTRVIIYQKIFFKKPYSKDIIKILNETIVDREIKFEVLLEIKSDNDHIFKAALELIESKNSYIKPMFSITYTPKCNANIESFFNTFKQGMYINREFLMEKKKVKDKIVYYVNSEKITNKKNLIIVVSEWINFYNERRSHGSTPFQLPPKKAEQYKIGIGLEKKFKKDVALKSNQLTEAKEIHFLASLTQEQKDLFFITYNFTKKLKKSFEDKIEKSDENIDFLLKEVAILKEEKIRKNKTIKNPRKPKLHISEEDMIGLINLVNQIKKPSIDKITSKRMITYCRTRLGLIIMWLLGLRVNDLRNFFIHNLEDLVNPDILGTTILIGKQKKYKKKYSRLDRIYELLREEQNTYKEWLFITPDANVLIKSWRGDTIREYQAIDHFNIFLKSALIEHQKEFSLTSHLMRKSMIEDLIDCTGILKAQILIGHADISSTQNYYKKPITDKEIKNIFSTLQEYKKFEN